MASIDFYALKDDIRLLVHFIFEQTDLRIFESYSEYDKELREFRSFDDLSGYGHWNEAGARQRGAGDADCVDWRALSQLSGCIQRHLRNKISVAKVRGR